MSIKYTRMITTESGDIYDFGVRHDSDFQNLEAYTYSNADRLDIAYNYAYDAYNNSLTNYITTLLNDRKNKADSFSGLMQKLNIQQENYSTYWMNILIVMSYISLL